MTTPLPKPWTFPYPARELYTVEQLRAYGDDEYKRGIEDVTAELAERDDAEIEQLTETSIWQAGRISELMDAVAAQRKVLEQALVALQSLFTFEVDEHRGERCASAITAIQEQLA